MATKRAPAKKAPAKKATVKKATVKKAAAKKAPAKKAPARRSGAQALPALIYAHASPHSVGGLSMFDASQPVSGQSAINFVSEESVLRNAASRLQAAGFQVLQISAQTINIAAPAGVYESAFGANLFGEDRPVIKEGAREDTAFFIESRTSNVPGLISVDRTSFADVLEGVAIEVPRYFMAASALAPNRAYWYLDVPGDISLGCNADRAHRAGITGKGVKVVMVDTGHFAHPYFTKRGYRVAPVVLGPAAVNAAADEVGHGTGESANCMANAPDVDFTMVKMSFVNSLGAFNAAVGLGPDIITCSWGSSIQFGPLGPADQALAAAIALAVANGIVVVFSAGNGHWGFPGQHPDVISAGGVFMANDESLTASDYASGFASNIYAGRNTPDVSGLVGMQPGASYIMLPIEPGDDIDTSRAGGTWPGTPAAPRDETTAGDGWSTFSGTSAAAPQLAGVAALIKQTCNHLTPPEIRDIMKATARDVTTGTNALGNTAAVGYDLATGAGLVDAYKAVQAAQIRCLRIRPPIPIIVPPIRPPVVIPPVVNPPIVVGPPIRPPVVLPPVVIVPPIRPPIVLPPVVREGHDAASVAAAMAAAGYGVDEIRDYLLAQPTASAGITEDQAALLEAALMESDTDLNL